MSADSRNRSTAVHVTARDRARATIMSVVDDRQLQSSLGARGSVVAAGAFHHVPAVVYPAVIGGDDVDLFVEILPDVGNVEQSRDGIKRVTPRVSQSFRPDLAATICLPDERVIGWDRVRIAMIDVEPE